MTKTYCLFTNTETCSSFGLYHLDNKMYHRRCLSDIHYLSLIHLTLFQNMGDYRAVLMFCNFSSNVVQTLSPNLWLWCLVKMPTKLKRRSSGADDRRELNFRNIIFTTGRSLPPPELQIHISWCSAGPCELVYTVTIAVCKPQIVIINVVCVYSEKHCQTGQGTVFAFSERNE